MWKVGIARSSGFVTPQLFAPEPKFLPAFFVFSSTHQTAQNFCFGLLNEFAGVTERLRATGETIGAPAASPQQLRFAPLFQGAWQRDLEVTPQINHRLFTVRTFRVGRNKMWSVAEFLVIERDSCFQSNPTRYAKHKNGTFCLEESGNCITLPLPTPAPVALFLRSPRGRAPSKRVRCHR